MRRARPLAVLALAVGLTILFAAPAAADPPGPSDYRTTITGLVPPTDAVTARVVGGDSFIVLRVERGHDVIVLGYRGEPYLRFRPDGTVDENRRSPTVSANASRYGSPVDPSADPAAAPSWVQVADDGEWAWHDHRTHWMSASPPLGASRGDVILQSAVPLRVDGQPASIEVASTWMPQPSWWPVVIGLAIGICALWATRGRRLWSVAAAATIAMASGLCEFLSVPTETGPSPLTWALPAVALVVSVGLLIRRSEHGSLATTAALCLGVWVVTRRGALHRAVLVTVAPPWLDRSLTAAVLVVGASSVVAGLVNAGTKPG